MTNVSDRTPLALPEVTALAPPDDLAERAAALGVTLGEGVGEELGRFLAMLLAMNERMNLTAIATPEEAWSRHVLDALTLLPLLAGLPAGARVVDVGSGGGLPAIPLAIARKDLAFTLVESTQKKAVYLRDVASALGLSKVTVVAERAEALIRGRDRASAEAVTARAVGRLVNLAPITLPFLKQGGIALLVKGQRADEELAEAADVIRQLGAKHRVTVPTPTGRIVVLERPKVSGATRPARR